MFFFTTVVRRLDLLMWTETLICESSKFSSFKGCLPAGWNQSTMVISTQRSAMKTSRQSAFNILFIVLLSLLMVSHVNCLSRFQMCFADCDAESRTYQHNGEVTQKDSVVARMQKLYQCREECYERRLDTLQLRVLALRWHIEETEVKSVEATPLKMKDTKMTKMKNIEARGIDKSPGFVTMNSRSTIFKL